LSQADRNTIDRFLKKAYELTDDEGRAKAARFETWT
jgi:hypothetical protein